MKKGLLLCLSAALLLMSCGYGSGESAVPSDEKLVVYCPHPLEFVNPIVAEFEERTGIPVFVCNGGTGELLEKMEAEQSPVCDVFWGGSLSTISPGTELFEPYQSRNEAFFAEEYKNREGNLTRFSDVPSVLMINTRLMGELKIEGYADLLQPELKGKIAMCDPAVSSSAYEHLINMLYAMGEGNPEDGWEYVKDFCKNLDGRLLKSSAEVYEGVAKGEFVVGLTFEEAAAGFLSRNYPVHLIYMKEGVLFTPDVVCVAREGTHRKEAEEFVDFVTGKDAQTVISDRLFRRSVRTDVRAPENLPEKESLPLISYEDTMGKDHKKEWQERFRALFMEVSAS